MHGSTPNERASVAATAAPVGVASSIAGPRAYTGASFKSSAVAGAGTGSMPCSVFTVPLPTLIGEQMMLSISSRSNARQAPTISAMESAAPTSWKWTLSMGTLVDLRLGLAQSLEDRDGIATRASRQVGLLDHLDDVRKMAVRLLFPGFDVEFGGRDPAALHFFERDGSAEIERGDGADNGVLIGAGIRQRAHQHIAANSGECVKVTSKRHETPL